MSLWERLKQLVERKSETLRFYPVRVRCDRCGEILETRINLHNDLSARYDDRGRVQGYFVRKVLHGSGRTRCFVAVEVELEFNARREVVARRARGGSFVDDEPLPHTE